MLVLAHRLFLFPEQRPSMKKSCVAGEVPRKLTSENNFRVEEVKYCYLSKVNDLQINASPSNHAFLN